MTNIFTNKRQTTININESSKGGTDEAEGIALAVAHDDPLRQSKEEFERTESVN